MLGLNGAARLIVNLEHRGRWQLRIIHLRSKKYPLLTKPRHQAEAELAQIQ